MICSSRQYLTILHGTVQYTCMQVTQRCRIQHSALYNNDSGSNSSMGVTGHRSYVVRGNGSRRRRRHPRSRRRSNTGHDPMIGVKNDPNTNSRFVDLKFGFPAMWRCRREGFRAIVSKLAVQNEGGEAQELRIDRKLRLQTFKIQKVLPICSFLVFFCSILSWVLQE